MPQKMREPKPASDDFIKEHDFPCWCGERSADVFCRQTFGRRPFAVLQCSACQTQRILPRALATHQAADTFYNTYDAPEPTQQDLQAGVNRCLNRLAKTGVRLKPGDRILDIGCGSGDLLEAICSRFGCIGHGIDADARRIEKARANSKHPTFENGLFEPSAYQEPFDIVLSTAVIEHVVDPVGFVQQLASVVKPGGSVYLLTPNAASLNYLILRSWWRELLAIGEHIYLFTPESLSRCAEQAGLTMAGVATDSDFVRPRLGFGGLRKSLITGWSFYCETVKRASSLFAGSSRGDILSAHFRKPPGARPA